MKDLILAAVNHIVETTIKRTNSIDASGKREFFEVGKEIVKAAAAPEMVDAAKENKITGGKTRTAIALEYMAKRAELNLEPRAISHWLKACQIVDAVPSESFYQNMIVNFGLSGIQEFAGFAKPENFKIDIRDAVAHCIDQGLTASDAIRGYVQTCRKVQSKKTDKKSVKKTVTNSKKVAMSRQIAKELLKAIQPAASETKTISLDDAIAGKGTKTQISAKLAEINTILSAIAAAK